MDHWNHHQEELVELVSDQEDQHMVEKKGQKLVDKESHHLVDQ